MSNQCLFPSAIAAVLLASGLFSRPLPAEPPRPTNSLPRLVRAIEFKEYGSKYVRLGDLDGDGLPEILLTQTKAPGGEHKVVITCLTALVLNGGVLWQTGQPDLQNIYFGSDFPVQIYDLDGDGSNEVVYIPDENNVLTILDGRSGKELLWHSTENFWWMGGLVVDDWTGNPKENFVGLYSRGFDPPALIDGRGREIAQFPFPAAILERGTGPQGKDRYDDYYMQHLDCYGDEREEILVFNHKELRIYTNAALWQKPRLYNNNYYPGRL